MTRAWIVDVLRPITFTAALLNLAIHDATLTLEHRRTPPNGRGHPTLGGTAARREATPAGSHLESEREVQPS